MVGMSVVVGPGSQIILSDERKQFQGSYRDIQTCNSKKIWVCEKFTSPGQAGMLKSTLVATWLSVVVELKPHCGMWEVRWNGNK